MTIQMLVIFYDFCQKLSVVTLPNWKAQWRHHFHYKSMKSRNPIFTKNAEKMPTIAECWQKQKKQETIQNCLCVLSVAINQVNCLNWDFFLKSSWKFEIVKILYIYEKLPGKLVTVNKNNWFFFFIIV